MASNEIKLDLKDRKILSELDFNARVTNSQLSKKIAISKKAVEYRIKQFEKKRVIIGYRPVINFIKLGYLYCRIFMKLQHMSEKTKADIKEYIIQNNYINWALWFRGEYDLGIGIWAKNLREFKENFLEFNIKFDKYIKEKRASIVIEQDHYPYDFILNLRRNEEMAIKEDIISPSIDDLDKKILLALTKNARKNSSEIAREIGSNYKVVLYRLNKLISKGVLMGTRAIIDPKLLGYTHYKVFLSLKQKDLEEYNRLKEYLRNYIGTVYFIDEVSISDFEIEVMCPSNSKFFKFLDTLQDNFQNLIVSYDYAVITETIKINFLPNSLI